MTSMKPKNLKHILYVGLFLIVITGIRLVWLSFQMPIDQPHAVKGVLDLREWDLPSKETLTLNGEWEFFPSQLLMQNSDSSSSTSADLEHNYIQVPGEWKDSFEEDQDSSFHYGTYKLKILLDQDGQQTYGLRINEIKNASAVYVNGQLMAEAGHPAQLQELNKAGRTPYSINMNPENNEIDLVIHASSTLYEGGIISQIYFGTQDSVTQRTFLSIMMQLMLCVVLFIHAVYAVILYFFGVAGKGMLYFSLLIFSAMVSVLTVDDRLLFVWIPFPYEWSVKIALLSYIGVAAFLPQIFQHIFREAGILNISRWFGFYCSLFALFVLIASSSLTLSMSRILLATALLLSMILTIAPLQRVLKDKEDVIFLLFAATSIANNIMWVSILHNNSIETMHYPFDLIFACLSFAAFWFKRFFRVNTQTKLLADKLQIADKQKDLFLANTSHELRNPLHGIINIAQSIMDDDNSPPSSKNRNNLEILIGVGRRMSLMLNDLLDVTRLKEGTVRLQLRSLHLQSLIGGVLDMLRFMTDNKPIRLHVDIDDSFPAVMADEDRLVQILFNLIHNAIKFTDEGDISVHVSEKNGAAIIKIRDTGIGMDEEVQLRIFQPYEQGDSNHARAGGGFGLGLSICKQLIELHGGTLQVSSASGQGSVFTFTLLLSDLTDDLLEDKGIVSSMFPGYVEAAASNYEPNTKAAPQAATTANRPKILAVDDDVINLNILVNLLSNERYDITTVTSGADALSKLEVIQYDLVIADVMMPHMSGYELTRSIRERFSISELPVLLVTARNRSEDIFAGFQAGANDYLTKPVEAWELRARVLALTDLKRSIGDRLRMEAAWLQAQIQPHFLFNTLNSIAALSNMDTSKMQALLEAFSNYLRTSFDFHNSDHVVPIERELSLVRSYLFIESERFEERLQIQWEVDENIHFLLPPLSIQPLVENAVRHGILRRSRGGIIRIVITDKMNSVEIVIKDDGVGMNEETLLDVLGSQSNTRSGIGLRNTDRRLKQMYGKGLLIQSAPNQGTIVSFQIPK